MLKMLKKKRRTEHPRITSDSDILNGVPVIKGTRIPVCLILEMFEGGHTPEHILQQYPSLRREDLQAALHFTAKLVAHA